MLTVGDVADQDFGLPAALDDFLLHFFELALRSAEENHLGSRVGKRKGRHCAKTAACAGYESDAAVQLE